MMWIVGAVVLAVVIWAEYLMSNGDDNNDKQV